MQNSVLQARGLFLSCTAILMMAVGCHRSGNGQAEASSESETGPIQVEVTSQTLQTSVKRLGINLGGQNYYDSGQMLSDLTFNNPGFEGETWQTILRCAGASPTSCTDANQWNQWPANFLQGADFEVLSGASAGTHGTVTESTAADHNEKDQGVSLRFAPMAHPPDLDDFVLVRKTIPGDPTAGWWTSAYGGAAFTAETADLSPKTPGKQALKITANGYGQVATLSSYFDNMAGHSFVRMRGHFRLSFRAKGLAGTKSVDIDIRRQTPNTPTMFFKRTVQLSPQWADYNLDFTADEPPGTTGGVALTFTVRGTDVLLDDAGLHVLPASPRDNPTAFRDPVVAALKQLHPGILRYQDGANLGSSLDNLIAPPEARLRAGWSEGDGRQTAVPMGLPEFLNLCKFIGAEPWITLPGAFSASDMSKLIEYLAAPATTPYGSKRQSQPEPWITVFPHIHLELGNEQWNGTTFAGEAINDPVIYGQRTTQVFTAARASQFYQPAKFDLVMGSFALVPDITRKELAAGAAYDSTAVAPYLLDSLDEADTEEQIFGPMFAEPEMVDSRASGYMAQQRKAAQGHNTNLSVYEVNLGTATGSAAQSAFDRSVPSIGGGLAVIDHMLLMLRDLGIRDQALWALTGFNNHFDNSATHHSQTTPLFGAVIDLGGATNRRRPQFLTEQLANQAIRPTMLATHVHGAQPHWQQERSRNDGIELHDAHALQTFAFTDGTTHSLVLLNLGRTATVPLGFTGSNAPHGHVTLARLTSANITDSNEDAEHVAITHSDLPAFDPHSIFLLPAFSMTVLEW